MFANGRQLLYIGYRQQKAAPPSGKEKWRYSKQVTVMVAQGYQELKAIKQWMQHIHCTFAHFVRVRGINALMGKE